MKIFFYNHVYALHQAMYLILWKSLSAKNAKQNTQPNVIHVRLQTFKKNLQTNLTALPLTQFLYFEKECVNIINI